MSGARYEFKYLLTDEVADEVRRHAEIWMEDDPYGDKGGYLITSLYLDRADWMLARQTWEGVRDRFKLRIRYYGETPEVIFTEVKRRTGCSIQKERVRIPPEEARPYAENGLLEHVKANDFRMLAEAIDAQPALWVRYRREAFVSPWSDGARLTLDTELEVQEARKGEFLPMRDQWRSVPLEQPVILEMKFNGAHPHWMRTVAEGLCLERTSCSKYAQGVETVLDGPWATQHVLARGA